MADIVIFGAGQTAEIASYYFENDTDHRVVAYTVDGSHLRESIFLGRPVVAFEEINQDFSIIKFSMHVAVSYQDLNKLRQIKYDAAKLKGYKLESYISSKAGNISPLVVGDNCLVLENQSIQPGVVIGNNVAVFGSVVLGHHSKIGDHCWLTSGAVLAGNTRIGNRCFLGVNCMIGHFVEVGDDSFIGAGALVTKSLSEKSVVIAPETEKYPLDSERFLKISKML